MATNSSRRKQLPGTGLFLTPWIACMGLLLTTCGPDKIDREALVRRHVVTIRSVDTLGALTVGNGKFAFTTDFTGLQSFFDLYEKGIPLGTQSEWGWHAFPDTAKYSFEETLTRYAFHGREVPYAVQSHSSSRSRSAAEYFRKNPHRLHLGIVGLDFVNEKGGTIGVEEIENIHQTLDPWTGEIKSTFSVRGVPVTVTTYAHPDRDAIAVRVESKLIEQGALRIKVRFPYPTGQHTDAGCTWNKPERHRSTLSASSQSAHIDREIDTTRYGVNIRWQGRATIREYREHYFQLEPEKNDPEFSFIVLFSPPGTEQPDTDFRSTATESRKAWEAFWESGGAVDFSGSSDSRAAELERRIILSQYLTRVQCAGNYPPQETGLTYNSWHGKFHLEMHWWHGVHHALWGRTHLLEKTLDYYNAIIEKAKHTARQQGFAGARWPKMTSNSGADSPSNVGSFLIWQQPHVIYMAELCFRDGQREEVLKKYADAVFATADFMASYAQYDSAQERYVLGPALIPAQERFPPGTTFNPPFELAYWSWGLATAQTWRKRLGLEPRNEWDDILAKISPLPKSDGMHLGAESAPDSYTNPRFMTDHPMAIGTYGLLPNRRLNEAIMHKTFDYVWTNWNWEETWGWDFPMTAMAATRLGMPNKALEALFMDVETNTYLVNGHNYQDKRLRIYLPGNGALLTAVAMMCAGYGDNLASAPGFPKDGTWKVRWEGLKKMP